MRREIEREDTGAGTHTRERVCTGWLKRDLHVQIVTYGYFRDGSCEGEEGGEGGTGRDDDRRQAPAACLGMVAFFR